LELDFPILSDPDREAAMAYGLVKNKKGMPARHTFYIGKDGKILYIDKAVKARNHGSDVAAKLEELGVDKK
jgi:peroxiredoxin Q/BCP